MKLRHNVNMKMEKKKYQINEIHWNTTLIGIGKYDKTMSKKIET